MFTKEWLAVLAVSLVTIAASSCALNPDVRKTQYVQSGEHYFEKGQYRDALIQFSNAVRIDPKFADGHRKLAETYLKLQQRNRAEQEFSEAVRLVPADYQTRIAMTNLLIADRKFDEAEDQAKLLLQQRPADPAVHSLDAALLAGEGRIPQAIGETQKTISLAPGRWEPYVSLAFLQMKAGDSNSAEASFKRVIELDPGAAEPHLLLGNVFETQNHLDEAEHEFREAMSVSAQTMEPREALAKLLIAEGKPAAAEQILLQASRDLPNNPQSALDLSNFYFITGDLNKAVAQYDALYRQRPNDVQLKKKYIELLIQVKRYDEAQRLDEEILRASPNDSDALLYRSQMEISAGHAADAIQTLQGVVRNAPENSEAHYALGVAFEKQGEPERAWAEWEETLRLDPKSLEAGRSLAKAALEKGDMRALNAAATQLIQSEPRAAEGYGLRALSYINMQQYQAAEQDAREAIAVNPQDAFGYVQLGNLQLREGHISGAVTAYQDALKHNPDSVDSLRGLVGAYIAMEQPEKAVSAIKAQIAATAPNSDFYALLGVVLFHSKIDLNAAQQALERATALDAHNAAAWIELCELHAAKGQLNQAIEVAGQALAANPGHTDLLILLGRLYESNSEWTQAQQTYRNVLSIHPQDPLASLGVARVMLQTTGNLDVAMSFVQTAREKLPDSPAVFDTMGWIYYHRGTYALALNSLQEALRLAEEKKLTSNVDIQYHLGMVYAKLNQPALAREHLQQVLKFDPGYSHAGEIKQELKVLSS